MKNSNRKYSSLEKKSWRILLLIFAGGLGMVLHHMSRGYLTCLVHEDSLPYFRTLITGIPVFGLLWFFRTHDTQAQLAKTNEQIKQNEYFNGLENLTNSDPLKIDVGVDQLIRLSKTTAAFNDGIKLAFIKRLKVCPIDFAPRKQPPRLTYAQWILSWLVDNYSIEEMDLNGCDFTNQDFESTNFQFAKIFNTDGKNKTQNMTFISASLQNADLQNACLFNAKLQNADLFNAKLQNANLRNANLYNAELQNTNLQKAKLQNSDLQKAKLQNSDLQNADLSNAKLQNADLSNAELQNSDLQNAKLQNADMSNAKLREANLQKANLRNASLANACLISAKFMNADLTSADLAGADLSGANLTGATLTAEKLFGAKIDDDTKGLEEFEIHKDSGSRIISCKVK